MLFILEYKKTEKKAGKRKLKYKKKKNEISTEKRKATLSTLTRGDVYHVDTYTKHAREECGEMKRGTK